jgi:hypothetical protein
MSRRKRLPFICPIMRLSRLNTRAVLGSLLAIFVTAQIAFTQESDNVENSRNGFGIQIPKLTYEDPQKSNNDPIFIRELYRYRPKLAEELERELRSAMPEQRSNVFRKYQDLFSQEIDSFHAIPESLRDKEFWTHWMPAAVIISQMNGTFPSKIADLSKQSEFENEIIKDVGFKDHHEFYDFLRALHPDDLGKRILQELKNLKDDGRSNLYADRLDKLEEALKNFRMSTVPSGESVLPELSPYSPLIYAKPPQSEMPASGSKTVAPQSMPSPCAQICGGQNNPEARAWCQTHCRD